MNKFLIPVIASILILGTFGFLQDAFAELDISNQRLISDDGNIMIEFTDNTIQKVLYSYNIKPNLGFGIMQLTDNTIFLNDAHVNILANSFTIKNYDQGFVMYAKNMGNDQFNIKVYTISDAGFQKQTFNGILTPVVRFGGILAEETITPQNPVITEEKTELHFLLDQYERVYNNAEYKFFVKTFDKAVYSGNDFQNFQGKLSGVKISAVIIDPNGELKTEISGFSENGVFEGVVYVPENLWMRGWYTVDMVIEYDEKFYHKQLTFYVYGQTSPTDGSNS